MAVTVTRTATYSRFTLLITQVRALLRETAGASDDTLSRVSKGLRPPHYIERVTVMGLYRNGKIGAELQLSINWREHSLMVKSGGPNVQTPPKWVDSVAPSLIEAITTFNDAVAIAQLTVEWTVTYATQFDRDKVNRELGFRHATRRVWQREPDRLNLGFGILTEAELVISLAID
jgi:hypothetical protein